MSENKQSPKHAEDSRELKDKRSKRRRKALRALVLRVLCLSLVIYALFFHIVGLTVMRTGDMYPRIAAGDLALFYRIDREFKAQDVIVIDKAVDENCHAVTYDKKGKAWWRTALDWIGIADPEEPEKTRFIARIIGRPGDVIDLTNNGDILVNGNRMAEPGIFFRTIANGDTVHYPIALGTNEYYVLADYREDAVDSRVFGVVTEDEIKGTVITVLRRNDI